MPRAAQVRDGDGATKWRGQWRAGRFGEMLRLTAYRSKRSPQLVPMPVLCQGKSSQVRGSTVGELLTEEAIQDEIRKMSDRVSYRHIYNS